MKTPPIKSIVRAFGLFCLLALPLAAWQAHSQHITFALNPPVLYVKSETAKIADTLSANQISRISIFGGYVGCPFDPDITKGAAGMAIAVTDTAGIEHLLYDLRQSQEPVGDFAMPGCFMDTLRIYFKPELKRAPLTWNFCGGNVNYSFSPEFYRDLQPLIPANKQKNLAEWARRQGRAVRQKRAERERTQYASCTDKARTMHLQSTL